MSYKLILQLMSEDKILEATKLKRECSKIGGLTDTELADLRDVPTFDELIYPILMSPNNAIGNVAHTIYDFFRSKDISDSHILQGSGLSSFDLKLVKEKRLSNKALYDNWLSYFLAIYGYDAAFSTEGATES